MNVQLLTRKEVADLLGISERTVTRKVKLGELITKKKGTRVYFPKEQFDNVKPEEKDTYSMVFETLQKQLEEKDKQIERLQDQLKEQGELVRNEQIISKGLSDRLVLLPENVEKQEKEVDTPIEEKKTTPKRKPTTKKKATPTPRKKAPTKKRTPPTKPKRVTKQAKKKKGFMSWLLS